MQDLTEHLVELIKSTSTDLSPDVEQELSAACQRESAGSAARGALETVLKNVRLSREKGCPICQDTGTPIFHIWYPEGVSQRRIREQVQAAIRTATERSTCGPTPSRRCPARTAATTSGSIFRRSTLTSGNTPTCASG